MAVKVTEPPKRCPLESQRRVYAKPELTRLGLVRDLTTQISKNIYKKENRGHPDGFR
jgi:hypothetical protein